ncbi:helix-turn-helix transcriptional regulator [Streptomyces naphthomycinicus]|uniref:helix-turn-helix transcriptional regulator n=1 Tax=Streptomyces naphthomycinicus TaxID=2872625 RepID=UPI001CEC017C|nr:helix-turn-helix transcriptional regulator [Streptomyces sp. TML10]
MNRNPEMISRTLFSATAEAASVPELGTVISRQIARLVPHDGYMLRGIDPLTGAACFLAKEHGYGAGFYRALETEEILGQDRHTVTALVRSKCPVAVLESAAPVGRHSAEHEEIMNAAEVGSEMRIALTHRGLPWGLLVLLRGRGSRPFSTTDAVTAGRLSTVLAGALRQYVAGRFLRPVRNVPAPGVVVIDDSDTIRAVTRTGRDWVRRLMPETATADEDEIFAHVWNIALTARQPGRQALSRVPGPDGWLVLQAQPLEESGFGGVAVTIQSASSEVLLPAAAVLYGITAREQEVIRGALDGLAVKQIARTLHLSSHTVNDHFRSIYRKTGVSSREELICSLT